MHMLESCEPIGGQDRVRGDRFDSQTVPGRRGVGFRGHGGAGGGGGRGSLAAAAAITKVLQSLDGDDENGIKTTGYRGLMPPACEDCGLSCSATSVPPSLTISQFLTISSAPQRCCWTWQDWRDGETRG
uniref:Uncharacterized protein n=1 Tax=Trieres chinensis TaxID=1514140 RepID=A0A7S2EB97_TRICV|mmetsp:Transcript_16025/g.32910  ORF Transcript_16025/g.32910 Transcript_16025/m.32910 type:complete len:129 (+) Transcript_16025:273-659(+)